MCETGKFHTSKSKTWQYTFSSSHEKKAHSFRDVYQTKASSSPFSLHSDVNIPFIFGPQRLTRFHDVAALLSPIFFCCPLHHSISIRVVLTRGCELGCVIWFRAEREHLFYKASAPSIPRASWKNPRPAAGASAAAQDLQTCEITTQSPDPLKSNLGGERRVTGLWNSRFKCVKSCRIYSRTDSD